MRTHHFWKKLAVVAVFVTAFCCDALGYQNQYLTHVKVESAQINLDAKQSAVVSWQIQVGGIVDLMICSTDGLVVRHLLTREPKNKGTHTASWNGLDDEGKPVPNGAYFPMIRLNNRRKGTEFYDPTAVRWGGMLPVKDLAYDPNTQQITYSLDRPALCLVRVGETEGGPSYGTLLSWAPRSAGNHSEPWDGKDIQGVTEVFDREKFKFIFDTIALPINTILVTGSKTPLKEADPQQIRIAVHPPNGNEVYIHSFHSRYICQDPEIKIEILKGASKSKKGPAVFRGRVSVSVTAADPERAAIMESMQSEIYLFVDGVFKSEIKAPTLPAVISMKTKGLARGRHTLTINLRDFEDHVGAMTIPFVIK
jgi:hypothetical protein